MNVESVFSTLSQIIPFLFPGVFIALAIGLGSKMANMIVKALMYGDDDRSSFTKHIPARPIEEMPKEVPYQPPAPVETVSRIDHYHPDPNRCEYCGSRIKRHWYRCPGCGATL